MGAHLARRVKVVAADTVSPEKSTGCYGGLVTAGAESKVVAQLSTQVKQQCGVDLKDVTTWYKFLELQYRDSHPTVFFLPALWEAGAELKAVPQASEETVEAEEEYEEEV